MDRRNTAEGLPNSVGDALDDVTTPWRFDGFEFDPWRGELRGRDGASIALRPKAEALLRAFLDAPGRLLPRDTLMSAVWPSTVVTDDSLVQCVGELRHALGDGDQRLIRTVPRRGYRLDCVVTRSGRDGSAAGADVEATGSADGHEARSRMEAPAHELAPATAAAAAKAPQAPRRISSPTFAAMLVLLATVIGLFAYSRSRPAFHIDEVIAARATFAIVPFEVDGDDPALRRLADAVADDIAAEFSTRAGMRALSRAATGALVSTGLAPAQVASSLKATGAVTGNVRRDAAAPASASIDVQLIVGQTGAVIWAARYERQDIADKTKLALIGRQVVNAVRNLTSTMEIERSESTDSSIDPAQLALRGWTDLDRRASIEDLRRARRRFKHALAVDPDSRIALNGYASSFGMQALEPANPLTAEERAEYERVAEHLLRLAPEDSTANLNWASMQIRRSRSDLALPVLDKAIRLVPSYPRGYVLRAEALLMLGRTNEVQVEIERAVEVAQVDSRRASDAFAIGAEAAIMLGEDERGLDLARRAVGQYPGNYRAQGALAAAEALTGHDASASLAALRRLWPQTTVTSYDAWPSDRPAYVAQRARFHEGLRRAGLPER